YYSHALCLHDALPIYQFIEPGKEQGFGLVRPKALISMSGQLVDIVVDPPLFGRQFINAFEKFFEVDDQRTIFLQEELSDQVTSRSEEHTSELQSRDNL